MGTTGYKVQPDHLFWVKVRLIGSSPSLSRMLEIAYVYTDLKLSSYHPGSHIVLHCSESDFKAQSQEQIKGLKQTGLYEACVKSTVSVLEAENMILNEFQNQKLVRGQLMIAGKQCHLVKYTLMNQMPRVHDFLHYRIFDVGSIELIVEGLDSKERSEKEKEEKRNFGSKRVNEELWQNIRQMQFYYNYALNDCV